MESQHAQASDLWQLAPRELFLPGDEVHIWRTSLLQAKSMVRRLAAILAEDELERSERFRFEHDRQKFIVARGVLRLILCRYLEAEPDQLRFGYGQYGKPVLFDPCGEYSLRFNLSHSADLVLYAVSGQREVGIDVESLRADFAYQEVATRFFSLREVGEIRALPHERQREAFFNCWTRKEAYVKARGAGLSFSLDSFEVPFASDEAVMFLGELRDRESASPWSLYNLPVENGYSAALVAEGDRCRLQLWRFATGDCDRSIRRREE